MNNVERKYRKPVNANGWMRKLQKWTWGSSTPDFVGYCPFFWFTWLTLLLSPLTLAVKSVVWLLSAAARIIVAGVPDDFWIVRLSDDFLLLFYEHYQEWGLDELRGWAGHANVIAWVDVTPDWENCVKRIVARRAKKAERAAIREPKRAAFANRLARYSSYIVKPILAAVVLVAAYFVLPLAFTGLLQLWHWILGITWADMIIVAKAAGILIIATFFGWALFAVFSRLFAGFKGCPKEPEEMTIFYQIGSVTFAGMEFIVDTIAALYTQECPLIEWGDHSEPIQSREAPSVY